MVSDWFTQTLTLTFTYKCRPIDVIVDGEFTIILQHLTPCSEVVHIHPFQHADRLDVKHMQKDTYSFFVG